MRPSYDNHAATIALRWPEHADPPAEGPAAPVACETSYYTVIVGWSDQPTQWHPTDRTGPFATLSRGAFPTERAAVDWARTHLDPDGSWHVRHVPPPVDVLPVDVLSRRCSR